MLLAGSGLAACGEDSAPSFSGGVVNPVRAAPALSLRDQRGRNVDLQELRGRAVLVSFLFANCPDTCPLTAANMRIALDGLGSNARDLEILTVSVDPEGDSPAAVRRFLRLHRLSGRMEWLTGTRNELERVWKAWGVATGETPDEPGLIVHSGQVFGIDAAGRIRTVYPADFSPEEVVADVPLLEEASG
jgi:protein SCO1/2